MLTLLIKLQVLSKPGTNKVYYSQVAFLSADDVEEDGQDKSDRRCEEVDKNDKPEELL